jgi:hypothetical protein
MRIAVISAPAVKKQPPDFVLSLAKGMESMGHRVDIIDVWTDDGMRLPGYEYIAIITEPDSFFSGKINNKIPRILAAGSTVTGKKSAAFVKKTGLFSTRALSNLMKAMEKEGMVINWSEQIISSAHAEALGKRIGV